ncbi:MAG TPA: hypothetical protein VNX86_04770 [Rhizomicrobium sp.]|jgi:hypothetical protein|nr:hypothetical protein [Rhizomicrobium sp.]
MAADVVWPDRFLVPADADARVVPLNTSGGVSFDGSEQIVGNGPGRIKITLGNIYLSSPGQVRAWHALDAVLQGRAGVVSMALFDYPRAPWPTNPLTGKIWSDPTSLFDDGTSFDDGTGFGMTTIIAYCYGGIAVGSNTTTIQIIVGGPLLGGEWFSPVGAFGSPAKAYRISRITGITYDEFNFPHYSVVFTPPCRVAVGNLAQVFFDDPLVDCRLETDDAMALKNGLELWRHGAPSLTLWEDV